MSPEKPPPGAASDPGHADAELHELIVGVHEGRPEAARRLYEK